MQKIIEKVIESKNYELSDMLKKIDTLWVQGSIDDAMRKSLSDKARNNANTQNSIDIFAKLVDLERRIEALELRDAEIGEEETPSYEEYKAGKWYYAGNKISFYGKNYGCIAPENVPCVWSPTEYPPYWEELEQPL